MKTKLCIKAWTEWTARVLLLPCYITGSRSWIKKERHSLKLSQLPVWACSHPALSVTLAGAPNQPHLHCVPDETRRLLSCNQCSYISWCLVQSARSSLVLGESVPALFVFQLIFTLLKLCLCIWLWFCLTRPVLWAEWKRGLFHSRVTVTLGFKFELQQKKN